MDTLCRQALPITTDRAIRDNAREVPGQVSPGAALQIVVVEVLTQHLIVTSDLERVKNSKLKFRAAAREDHQSQTGSRPRSATPSQFVTPPSAATAVDVATAELTTKVQRISCISLRSLSTSNPSVRVSTLMSKFDHEKRAVSIGWSLLSGFKPYLDNHCSFCRFRSVSWQ